MQGDGNGDWVWVSEIMQMRVLIPAVEAILEGDEIREDKLGEENSWMNLFMSFWNEERKCRGEWGELR